MRKTEFIRARIEPDLKIEVHEIFHELGITPTQAITMFYKLIQRQHGLPVEFVTPNRETIKAITEARQRKGVVGAKNAKDLFKKLGIRKD
jgi:DNA-damage-inducible protein J